MKISQGQAKSKDRVTDRDEVFTFEREVNAMLDLVNASLHVAGYLL